MFAAAIVAADVRGDLTPRSGASGCGESGIGISDGCGEGISGGESRWGGGMETSTVFATVERAAMAAGMGMKEARLMKGVRLSTEAPVVTEPVIGQTLVHRCSSSHLFFLGFLTGGGALGEVVSVEGNGPQTVGCSFPSSNTCPGRDGVREEAGRGTSP